MQHGTLWQRPLNPYSNILMFILDTKLYLEFIIALFCDGPWLSRPKQQKRKTKSIYCNSKHLFNIKHKADLFRIVYSNMKCSLSLSEHHTWKKNPTYTQLLTHKCQVACSEKNTNIYI